MIYFLITTSYTSPKFSWTRDERKKNYINGINSVPAINAKVIIIENNGNRKTFLNKFGYDVFYTNNNSLNLEKGTKELTDILDCIKHYNIADDDFIVKMTGRYILEKDSPFIQALNRNANAIIRYGSYLEGPSLMKKEDCITGLIGMKCKYIKSINFGFPIEVQWGKVLLDVENVVILEKLGIKICPGNVPYFLV